MATDDPEDPVTTSVNYNSIWSKGNKIIVKGKPAYYFKRLSLCGPKSKYNLNIETIIYIYI